MKQFIVWLKKNAKDYKIAEGYIAESSTDKNHAFCRGKCVGRLSAYRDCLLKLRELGLTDWVE